MGTKMGLEEAKVRGREILNHKRLLHFFPLTSLPSFLPSLDIFSSSFNDKFFSLKYEFKDNTYYSIKIFSLISILHGK